MVRAIILAGFVTAPLWCESGPVFQTSVPAIVGNLLPGFYNGYLYSRVPTHSITLFAPSGRILTVRIDGHGNGGASIESVAVGGDGMLAIGWIDQPDAGIDIRDPGGNLIRSIDTGLYLPAHLSFGDGALWAFGWQRDANREWAVPAKDYQTVRKYSMDGKEIAAYLPRSLFPPGLQPGGEGWQERRITVTKDRVGIEANSGDVGNQREWVELGLDGSVLGRWRLDQAQHFPGVTLTSDNQVYVHRSDSKSNVRQVFKLNRAESKWEAVTSPIAELYGVDGDKLVFAEWSTGIVQLSWYPQP